MNLDNPVFDTDSYKYSHFLQLPPGTRRVSSYIEARPGGDFDRLVFFGLQGFLKRYLSVPITHADIDEAEPYIKAHGLPFNRAGFEAIVNEHGGHWPVEIEALPEGLVVPVGTPVVQLHNTDPELPWVGAFLETSLLRGVWYPSTVATLSWHAKQVIRAALEKSCENPEAVLPFRLHDFGARGTTCREQAQIGGAAHLVNFLGTDTVEGMVWASEFYGAEGPAGYSIPASEHSTITAWGEARESEAFANMIETFFGEGRLTSVVSDSYDLERAVRQYWGKDLKDKVLAFGGTLVVRPDSGDPLTVPVKVIEWLGEAYGTETNAKGYKVLNPAVRIIQGDGMNLKVIGKLLDAVLEAGWSAENLAMGMGGGLLQQIDRDTLRWAQKANAIMFDDGTWVGVNKTVKTDPSKSSKKGRQGVVKKGKSIKTVDRADGLPLEGDLLRPVWKDGELLRQTSFDEVRRRSEA